MNQDNKTRYIPIIIAISVVAGIFIGTFYNKRFANNDNNGLGIITSTSNKLNGLLGIIEEQYVDTVNISELIEDAMPQILGELDPHSSYIPAKDLQAVNDELSASFSGIGIQFTIQQDTIHISDVISGGPSEKVGILAGDRITAVEDTLIAGVKMSTEEIMSRLRGPKGSVVKLTIIRRDIDEPLTFEVKRDKIPIYSLDASYMITPTIGYIR